jgi:hypothetical protein
MQRKTRNEKRATGADEERETRDARTMCGLWDQAQSDPARVGGETLALCFSACHSVMMGIREDMVGSRTCK